MNQLENEHSILHLMPLSIVAFTYISTQCYWPCVLPELNSISLETAYI